LNLKKYVLEILSSEWTTSDELAKILSMKFPNEIMFDKDYKGDISILSQALGPTLWGLKNNALIEDDGVKWPEKKRWRKPQQEEKASLNKVIKSLIDLNYAQNENKALRILALRAIRENPDDYKKIVGESEKIEETKRRLLKTIVGTKKKSTPDG